MIKCLLHFIWAVFIISSEQCSYEAVYLELQVQLSHSSGWSSCLETSSFAVKLSAALVPETNQQKVHSVSILLHLTETKPRNKPEISVWGRLQRLKNGGKTREGGERKHEQVKMIQRKGSVWVVVPFQTNCLKWNKHKYGKTAKGPLEATKPPKKNDHNNTVGFFNVLYFSRTCLCCSTVIIMVLI